MSGNDLCYEIILKLVHVQTPLHTRSFFLHWHVICFHKYKFMFHDFIIKNFQKKTTPNGLNLPVVRHLVLNVQLCTHNQSPSKPELKEINKAGKAK